MKRFFGMMPSEEVEKEKLYIDKHNRRVTIQAGLHGWTIIWADNSVVYADEDNTTENNFQKAYDTATQMVGQLTETVIPMSQCAGLSTTRKVPNISNSCEAMYMDN